jgi:hypothetical protein
MTIPHIKLQIEYLTAIAAGKRMEWRQKHCLAAGFGDLWARSDGDHHPTWNAGMDYEIREVKRQQYIPECDVPRALEVEPDMYAECWTISPFTDCPVTRISYTKFYLRAFKSGWLWATEADARAAWDAMTARRER